MRNTLYFSILIFFLVGCKKEKFATTPHLKFESVNTDVLRPGNVISFNLSFTDAEGDLTGDLYVEKFEPKCANSGSADIYKLPDFPTAKNQAGNIIVSLGYRVTDYPQQIKEPQCENRNDTCVFKFVLSDKAQHHSDTAVSKTIVIIRG